MVTSPNARANEVLTLSDHIPKQGSFLPATSKSSLCVSFFAPILGPPHVYFCDISHYSYPIPAFSLHVSHFQAPCLANPIHLPCSCCSNQNHSLSLFSLSLIQSLFLSQPVLTSCSHPYPLALIQISPLFPLLLCSLFQFSYQAFVCLWLFPFTAWPRLCGCRWPSLHSDSWKGLEGREEDRII